MACNAGKKILHCCVSGKNSNSRGFGRKKFLPKPNHPYKPPPPPSEIKWSAPRRLPYYWDPRLLQHWLKKLYLHFILIIIRKIEESASKQAIAVLIKICFAFTVFYFLFDKSNSFLAAFYGRSLGETVCNSSWGCKTTGFQCILRLKVSSVAQIVVDFKLRTSVCSKRFPSKSGFIFIWWPQKQRQTYITFNNTPHWIPSS